MFRYFFILLYMVRHSTNALDSRRCISISFHNLLCLERYVLQTNVETFFLSHTLSYKHAPSKI